MKKSFVFLVFLVSIFSCQKNKVDNSIFKGTWEYENYSGYPFTNTALPPGNGRIIVLSANGNFEKRQHDTVLFKGRYFLERKKDCYGDEEKVHFNVNDPGFSWDSYISIDSSSGKLKLTTPNCNQDVGITTYRKISN